MANPPKTCSRRQALVGMATLAGSALLGRKSSLGSMPAESSSYAPILTTQIYVWTQQFQAQNKTLTEGLEEALPAIRRAGYGRVELIGDFFRPDFRAKTLALLKKHELEIPTLYAGSKLHEEKAAEKSIADILALAEALEPAGLRALTTNPSPKPRQERKSDEELDLQAGSLNRLGDELQKRGVRLLVHHHTPELVDNAREWRHQLEHTDPKLVACCVDVHWAFRGGQDPLAFLRETGNRLASVHLRNSRDGVWMEDFGDGDIDYRKVAEYLREMKYNGYLVVELAYEKGTKTTRSLEENLRLSRIYTEGLFGPELA
ncbi:MAG: TIM barrel protein [Acidobacteria bacterium]|nr:TIM barrel protein [Acidobacteriota bacterium]